MPLDPGYPLLGFFFRVSFMPAGTIAGASFQNADGISLKMKTDSYQEGGQNGFSLALPSQVEYPPLKLTGGIMPTDNGLYTWCKQTIQSGFETPISPKQVQLELLADSRTAVRKWVFYNSWPISWQIEGFNAMENKVVIQTLEIHYDYFVESAA